MAFPASQVTARLALDKIADSAARIKLQAQGLRDSSASGATSRRDYIALLQNLQRAVDLWDSLAATPGLIQYAKDQYNDQTLDISVAFTDMRTAALTLRDWIFSNIPKDAGGALLLQTISNIGVLSDLTVSTAATAQFRTEADAFTATVG